MVSIGPLPRRLEQLDRISVGIFDLDLSTAGVRAWSPVVVQRMCRAPQEPRL